MYTLTGKKLNIVEIYTIAKLCTLFIWNVCDLLFCNPFFLLSSCWCDVLVRQWWCGCDDAKEGSADEDCNSGFDNGGNYGGDSGVCDGVMRSFFLSWIMGDIMVQWCFQCGTVVFCDVDGVTWCFMHGDGGSARWQILRGAHGFVRGSLMLVRWVWCDVMWCVMVGG